MDQLCNIELFGLGRPDAINVAPLGMMNDLDAISDNLRREGVTIPVRASLQPRLSNGGADDWDIRQLTNRDRPQWRAALEGHSVNLSLIHI